MSTSSDFLKKYGGSTSTSATSGVKANTTGTKKSAGVSVKSGTSSTSNSTADSFISKYNSSNYKSQSSAKNTSVTTPSTEKAQKRVAVLKAEEDLDTAKSDVKTAISENGFFSKEAKAARTARRDAKNELQDAESDYQDFVNSQLASETEAKVGTQKATGTKKSVDRLYNAISAEMNGTETGDAILSNHATSLNGMTDTQKNTYAWLMENEGAKSAYDYYNRISESIKSENAEYTEGTIKKIASEHPYIATAVSSLAAPAKILGSAGVAAETAASALGANVSENSSWKQLLNFYNTVDETVPEATQWAKKTQSWLSDKLEDSDSKIGQAAYDKVSNWNGQILGHDADEAIYTTVKQALDNFVNMGIASGSVIAGADSVALANPVYLSKQIGNLGAALLSSEMLGDAILNAKKEGKTDVEALTSGIMDAGIEYLTERIGGEKVVGAILSGKSAASQLFTSVLSEIVEEVAGNGLGNMFDWLGGFFIENDDAYRKVVEETKENGGTVSAFIKALNDNVLREDAFAMLSAGLSAFGTTAGTAGVRTAQQNAAAALDTAANAEAYATAELATDYEEARKTGASETDALKTAMEHLQTKQSEIADKVLATDADNKVAKSVKNKIAAGKTLTSADIYNLDRESRKQQSAENRKLAADDARKAIAERIKTENVKNADQITEALSKWYAGLDEDMTEAEADLIQKDATAHKIAEELLNPRAEGNRWARTLQSTVSNRSVKDKGQTVNKHSYVETADGTTGSVEAVHWNKDTDSITVDVKSDNGTVTTQSISDIKMDTGLSELLDIASKYGSLAPAIYEVYSSGIDMTGDFENAVDYIVAWAKASRLNKTEALEYLKKSGIPGRLTETQVATLYEAAQTQAQQERQETGKTGSGTGTVSYEGGVKYEDLSETQKNSVDAITSIVKALKKKGVNIDVTFFKSATTQSGDFIGKQGEHCDGKIKIDINSGLMNMNDVKTKKNLMLAVMSHEMTHWLQQTSPAEYAKLKSFVLGHLTEWKYGKLDDLVERKRKISTIAGGLSYDNALDEIVADACEFMLRDSKAIKSLVDEDATLAEKVAGHLSKIAKRIADAFDGADYMHEEARYMAQYKDELVQLWDDALNASEKATEKVTPESGNLMFSILEARNIEERSNKYFANHKGVNANISSDMLTEANNIVNEMAEYMKPFLSDKNKKGGRYLPEEILGKTTFDNGSYGKTIENTTICFRTLAYIDFTNEIKERIGRPLTVEESFLASQMLCDIAKEPQCVYCYVSLDRKAYDEFLLKYTEQRDAAMEKYRAANIDPKERLKQQAKSKTERSQDKYKLGDSALEKIYKEYLHGREDSPNQRNRFNMWIDAETSGDGLITNADLTTEEKRSQIKNAGGSLADQVIDAEAYAQGASWAKKMEQYRSYNSDILKMGKKKVDELNALYGLRFYSFSEYTPAFIVENMQQIRDAALKGLYGLAYTKKPDFARIFAKTGMNINISVYGRMDGDHVVMDDTQGANWDEVKDLRKKYKNVGAVFVATTDELTEWALDQDWIDVVIPFHIVRTGANIAEFYKWVNNTKYQADIDAAGSNKTITAAEHHNDKKLFLQLCKERGLTPRFEKWLSNKNYMKLVNETRQSMDESSPLVPNFDKETLTAAKKSFNKFVDEGGYYGDWYRDGADYAESVDTVVNDILSGKRANEVDYGRQDIPYSEAMKNRKNRVHGQSLTRNSERDNSAANTRKIEILTEKVSGLQKEITKYKNILARREKNITKLQRELETTFKGQKDRTSIDDAGSAFIRSTGSKTKLEDIRQDLYDLYDMMAKRENGVRIPTSMIEEAAYEIARRVVDEASVTQHSELYDDYAELRGQLKDMVFVLNDSDVSNIEDYADWRRRHSHTHMRKAVGNEKSNIDTNLIELLAPEDEQDHPVGMGFIEYDGDDYIQNFIDFANKVEEMYETETVNPHEHDGLDNVAKGMATDLMLYFPYLKDAEKTQADRYIDEGIRTYSTMADDTSRLTEMERRAVMAEDAADRSNEELQTTIRKMESDIAYYNEQIAAARKVSEEHIDDFRNRERRKQNINSIKRMEKNFQNRITGKGNTPSVKLIQQMINVCQAIDTSSIEPDIPTPAQNKDGQWVVYLPGYDLPIVSYDYDQCVEEAIRVSHNLYENRKSVQSYEAWKNSLDSLASLYDADEIKAELGSDHDDEMSQMIRELRDKVDGKKIKELSNSDLEAVREILARISHEISIADKLIGQEQHASVQAFSQKTIDEIEALKVGHPALHRLLKPKSQDNLNILRIVDAVSGYNEDGGLNVLFRDILNGTRKADTFRMKANKMFEDLQEGDNKKHYMEACTKYEKFDGFDVKMTRMQAMQLILSWDREAASRGSLEHLAGGGFIIPNEEQLKSGDQYAAQNAIAHGEHTKNVTYEQMAQLKAQLKEDKWTQDYMKTASEFFNGLAADAINETTLILKNRKTARSVKYIPFEVDPDVIQKELDGVKFDASVMGKGMLKDTVIKSHKELIIRGLDSVLSKHIEDAAQVYGLAVPLRNFNKAWSTTYGNGSTQTINGQVKQTFGAKTVESIENAITDLQRSRPSGDSTSIGKLMNSVKGWAVNAALAGNLSVTIKQAASYSTAKLYLSERALAPYQATIVRLFAANKSKFAQNLFKEIDAHTASHWTRRIGMDAQKAGERASLPPQFAVLADKIPDAFNSLKWIQNMDVATTAALWLATKKQIELDGKYKKGSAEYWTAVTELYDKVISETQPMYDTIHRPEIQKTKNNVIAQMFMFQTQPLQNAGILRDAYGAFSEAKLSGDKARIKETGKTWRMAVVSQVTSSVVFCTMTLLANAALHKKKRYLDDDEQLTTESVVKRMFLDLVETWSSLIIPVYGSAIATAAESTLGINSRWYDTFSVSSVDAANDMVEACQNMIDKVMGVIQAEDGTTRKTAFAKLGAAGGNLAMEAASFTGIPAQNFINVINGFVNNAKDIINGELPYFNNNVEGRSNTSNYNRMYAAIVDGDEGTALDVYAELQANGVSEDTIGSRMRTMITEGVASGEIDEATATDWYTTFGVKESEVDKKVSEATCARDTGIAYSDLGDKFLSGDITAEQYKSYLIQYGGLSTDAAAKKAREMSCERDTGYVYDNVKSDYRSGAITRSKVVSIVQKYGGKSSEEAEATVQQWDYQDLTGDDSASASEATTYYSVAKPAGVSASVYHQFHDDVQNIHDIDEDGDGKADNKRQSQIIQYIYHLDLSSEAKTALYCTVYDKPTKSMPWE